MIYTRKPRNLKAFIAGELSWSRDGITCECLDTAIVHRTTAYSAVSRAGDPEFEGVTCYVTLLDFYRKGQIGFKILNETVGPVKDNCPRKIYDLLTPLPEPAGGLLSHARDWRARVERNFELDRQFRLKLKEGNTLVPKDGRPIPIQGYGLFDRFVVIKAGRRTLLKSRGQRIQAARHLVDQLAVAGTEDTGDILGKER